MSDSANQSNIYLDLVITTLFWAKLYFPFGIFYIYIYKNNHRHIIYFKIQDVVVTYVERAKTVCKNIINHFREVYTDWTFSIQIR